VFECALCLASAPFAPDRIASPFHLSSSDAITSLSSSGYRQSLPILFPCSRHLHAGTPREDAYYQRMNKCVALDRAITQRNDFVIGINQGIVSL